MVHHSPLIRPLLSSLSLALVVGLAAPALVACDSSKEEEKAPEKRKKLSEMKQAGGDEELSEEELKKKREALGIRDQDEVAAEIAAEFEKGAREYVKTRVPQYRDLVKAMRDEVSDIETNAKKWADAKDPAKAFEKWHTAYKEGTKAFDKTYDELTGKGAEGGNTQATISSAYRTLEGWRSGMNADVAKGESFDKDIEEIRKIFDEIDKALDDIEKDESLVIDSTVKTGDEKKDE